MATGVGTISLCQQAMILEIILLMLTTAAAQENTELSGLEINPFRGHLNVQHVQCTGESLTSDSDVLLMTLFEHPNDTTVASVNLGNKQCSTSMLFSSCEIDVLNTRKTKVNTLLVDLPYGDIRIFGCNVTFSRSRGRSGFKTWYLQVNITVGK